MTYIRSAPADKGRRADRLFRCLLLTSWGMLAVTSVIRADQIKANNTNNLELGASWVSGSSPGGTDSAIWDSTLATLANCTNVLGMAQTWNAISIRNPAADITIDGNNGTLTLANGIDMSGATVNFNLNCGTVTLGANQTWNIPQSYTLTTGSLATRGRVQNNTITKTGGGTWTTSGTDDNGGLGVQINSGTVNLDKSSGTAHAVGGNGLMIYTNGLARITGSGGDQIYDYASVTMDGGTFDLNGHAETISHLYFNSGTLENSSASGLLNPTGGVILGGTNCTFDVAPGGSLTIAGAISGNYQVNKIDTGVLILSGTNTYTGITVISAGEVTGATSGSSSNSTVTVNNGATNGVAFTGGNSQWVCSSLTYAAGMTYADFNFGANLPSLTAAPLQVNGNLTLIGALNVVVRGSAIPAGTYPLIKYSGVLAGTPPGAVSSLPNGVTATIVNNTGNKSFDLSVTSGNVANQIMWGVGNGTWDVNTTANWNNRIGSRVVYQDGSGVIFDDTASGISPIAITLNTTVSPANVTANNSAKNYVISGSGAITGTNGLIVQGNGTLTISTTNSYSGGTTLDGGQLNINNGGGSGGGSAIGSGVFTINGGVIDNTSGADVSLASNNAQNWNASFTYAGSAHNLNLGAGTVSVATNLTLTISSNTLTTGGRVNSNKIAKTGNGAWTISGGNSTDNNNLGIIVNAGVVNLNKSDSGSHCVGGGGLVINGGTARITGTGGDQIYDGASVTINGGTLDLYGHNEAVAYFSGYSGAIDNTAAGTSATLTCAGNNSAIYSGTIQNSGSNAKLALTKLGTGTLTLTGFNSYSGGTLISAGVLQLGAGTDMAPLASSAGTGPVTNNAILSLASSQFVTISNTVGGSGSVSVNSGGAILVASNTYLGATTINANNWLQLAGNGSLLNSSNIIIASGAQLDVSGRVNPWMLQAGQRLTVSNADAVLVGNVNLNAGALTLNYSAGTPALTVENGVMALSNNAVTITVLGNTPLAVGSYPVISPAVDENFGFDGGLTGSVFTSSLTVNGAGLAANTKATLQMDATGLYLDVAASTATISTTTVLGSLVNPSTYGSAAVFTVNINPAPTDGELVVFRDGPTTLGSAAISGGAATFTCNTLWFGLHTITAAYAGDGKYLPSAGSIIQSASPFSAAGQNAMVSGGMTTTYFTGVPGYLYDVQRSTNLNNATGWVTVAAAVIAAANGSIQITDTNSPQPAAFYRLSFNADYASVPAMDVALQPVPLDNLPVFGYITAYDVNEQTVTNALGAGESPLYYPYDACTTIGGLVVETAGNDAWWDNLVAEQLQARLPLVMLSTCGAYTTNATDLNGPGNINPRRLKYWLSAVQRAGATNMFQTCCFAEAAAQGIYQNYYGLPSGALYDFANSDAWTQVWWLRIIKPWFDNVPTNTWYYLNGGVPIECWGLNITSIYTNQQGNISKMFNCIATNLQAAYGITPRFIMGSLSCDTTLTNCQWMVGDNEWFGPPSTLYTMTPYKGYTWGGMVAGYINPAFYGSPTNSNYLNPNAVVPRNGQGGGGQNGDSFKAGFNAAVNTNAIFTMIEGYTDVSESCGPYRSLSTNWDYPNQYLNIVRSYTDLRTVTLRLEAEGCDEYANAAGNPGGVYRRTGTLGVRSLTGGGWAVTGTVAGEWIQFTNLLFSPGNYKFVVRYSAVAAHTLQLYVDGVAQSPVTVPSTGDLNVFNLIYLATQPLAFGNHVFKLKFIDGGVDVDWLFIKKYDPLMSFKSSLNGCYLTAKAGGNDVLAATNGLVAGNWEKFSVDDPAGAGTVTNGDSVNLQVFDGLYITAVNGGGGAISAKQRSPGSNETLTVVKLNGSGALTLGDQIALRTPGGDYVTVQPNGTVDATGASIGAAQTFNLDAIGSQ